MWFWFGVIQLHGRCFHFFRFGADSYPVDNKLRLLYVFQVQQLKVSFIHFSEGYLTSCTFDYLTDTFDNQLFVAVIFTFSYAIPMFLIMFFYSQIVKHVFSHEKKLREQAKKMNVESLRSNKAGTETAEIRIAKAAITVCFLFVASWTPYGKQIKFFFWLQRLFVMKKKKFFWTGVMALIGAFGNKQLLTPGVTMIPACTCKFVACIDPYVYAISHPKYRSGSSESTPPASSPQVINLQFGIYFFFQNWAPKTFTLARNCWKRRQAFGRSVCGNSWNIHPTCGLKHFQRSNYNLILYFFTRLSAIEQGLLSLSLTLSDSS